MNSEQAIARGFARHSGDENRLRQAGVKVIYRADKGEVLGKFKMRKGELLGTIGGLSAFGSAKRDWTRAEELVHSWGAAIVDIETGMRSDRNGAMMFDHALRPRRPSEEYAAMQAKSVEARIGDRMGKRKAAKIWFNQRLSTDEKVDLTGWPISTLYRVFGKSGVPAGRRKK